MVTGWRLLLLPQTGLCEAMAVELIDSCSGDKSQEHKRLDQPRFSFPLGTETQGLVFFSPYSFPKLPIFIS